MACLSFRAGGPSGSRRRGCLALFFAAAAALVFLPRSPVLAGPAFPPSLSVEKESGERLHMRLTGQSKRVILFFRIYEIAHYAALAGDTALAPDEVVEDGPGKALMIRFQRDLGVERIREEFASSLRRNAQPEWLKDAEPTINDFLAAIDRGARDGDRLVFFWPEGGRLLVEFNGERAFTARDAAFARLIWSIWFGANPVCDREELLARLEPGAEP